jgi:hypothetical protein
MTHPDNELDPERLERLMEDVARLPREVAPSRDAWPEIRQRIEAQRVRSIAPASTKASRRKNAMPVWLLGAAATILVTVMTMLRVANRAERNETPPVAVDPIPAPPSQLGVVPIVPIAAGFAEANPALAAAINQYHEAMRELEAEVATRAAGMSPATREVVRRSLATIDTAIADLRAALGTNPRDVTAGQSLGLVYERKLEFLKRVRSLPGTGM